MAQPIDPIITKEEIVLFVVGFVVSTVLLIFTLGMLLSWYMSVLSAW